MFGRDGRGHIEKQREVFLISESPQSADDKAVFAEAEFRPGGGTLLGSRAIRICINAIVNRRHTFRGDMFVLDQMRASAFRNGDDVRGERVHFPIQRTKESRKHQLVVAVVVVDSDAPSAKRSQWLGEKIRPQKVTMHHVVSLRGQQPQEARKIKWDKLVRREREHRHIKSRKAFSHRSASM